jgi:hypothetical protein
MSSTGVAPRAAPLSPRAEASRRNGAKSRGPKTPEGKARSAQNALKHGFRAQQHIVLPSEDAAAFEALEAALLEELAPEGALQCVLAQRIVSAAWRLERAERLEAELFERHHFPGGDLGLALIRDGNGPRSFDTLLRYRGGTLAELWRALRTLKALQAEAADRVRAISERQPELLPPQPGQTSVGAALAGPFVLASPEQPAHCQTPIEPEARTNPRETASVPAGGKVLATVTLAPPEEPPAHGRTPIEPEARGNPGEIAPAPAADAGRGVRGDLGAQVTQKCVTNAPLGRHACAIHASPPADSA